MIRPDPATQAAWASLANTYRWLYDCSLQDRLAGQVDDVNDWFNIGGAPARRQRDLTAGPHTPVWSSRGSRRFEPTTTGPTVSEPAAGGEASPLAGRPRVVREIILRTAAQTGVPVEHIMGGRQRQRWADVQARHLVVRRLAALSWLGDHPNHGQIARWLNIHRTSVFNVLQPGA